MPRDTAAVRGRVRAPRVRLAVCLVAVLLAGGGAAIDAAPSPSTPVASPTATEPRDDEAAIAATRARFAAIAPDEPGCSLAVGRDGRVVFAGAYGAARLDPLVPMTTDTVVDIGSTSKQFTATAILLLAERGLVDLDQPLATYLPDLPAWSSTVTVRQMVHHQSGIPDYIDLLVRSGTETTEPATDADALRVLGEADALAFPPGEGWAYSNSNYFLLGQIVLGVTGDDLGAFLDREVFGPLALDAVMDPTAAIPGKATSYAPAGAGWEVADSPWEQLGDGGIQTTPTQLVAWATQYWAPTLGGADVNAIRLADAVDTGEGDRYGFGIAETTIDGVRVLTHAGGWAGFITSFVVAPAARLVVTGTCNSTNPPLEVEPPYYDIAIPILLDWL